MKMRMSLGQYQADVEAMLSHLDTDKIVERIWQKDHTVWQEDPTEITDRLGWLSFIDLMREKVPELESFLDEIRNAGFQYVVLLGMGGSSLGPEVLRAIFGKIEGHPELIVLDSINPAWIRQVQDQIDLKKTLFLVASKSGSTIEIQMLLLHFKSLVESITGKDSVGTHFVAITDKDSPLAKQAIEMGFRRIFENPSDIGGRYSVLSLFGLVPAVLAGLDINRLLDESEKMKQWCSSTNAQENPGAVLGTIISVLALKSRDKLTLMTSPGVSRFGLWVEQLIAESTGKEGKGIIPVAGEPIVDPQYYGNDRLFLYLRFKGDDNIETDAGIESIADSGQPVATIEMQDRYDLGAEFFRWQFGVSVACSLLGINPFDQPDVQSAKDAMNNLLQVHADTGDFPQVQAGQSLEKLLSDANEGKYLSIMAYIMESPETERDIDSFRRIIMERYSIATTFGYGPSFLHSTGQLHKGGPNSNLSLQLTVDHCKDLPIPGKPYSFGQLLNAQAMSDLKVLKESGRSIVNLHFSGGDDIAIKELIGLLY